MARNDSFSQIDVRPRQLRLLVALDDFRNVGKVAANLNVTQPAVSKALAELEKRLGVALFERTARGIHPTVYGECLIRHARSALAEFTRARDELRGLILGESGNIAVGALSATALALLPGSLALLKRRSPNTTVLIREGTMEALLPELWQGKLDLIVGRLPPNRPAEGLEEKILMEEPVTLVADRHHPLARKRRLRWSDLTGFPWVLPPGGTLLREPLERAFETNELPMPVNHIETLSVHILIGYLQLTDAIALLPGDVSRHFQNLGLIAILDLEMPKLVRPVGVTWNRERPLSPSARLLLHCLEQVAHPGRSGTDQ